MASESMTWGEAYLLLERGLDAAVEVSRDGWLLAGKAFFLEKSSSPGAREGARVRELFFRNSDGAVYAHFPNAWDRQQEDWRVGPSRGAAPQQGKGSEEAVADVAVAVSGEELSAGSDAWPAA